MPSEPGPPTVVVLVAQLPCGSWVQLELTLRVSSAPAPPPRPVPVVVA
jgi:hypothetical protein